MFSTTSTFSADEKIYLIFRKRFSNLSALFIHNWPSHFTSVALCKSTPFKDNRTPALHAYAKPTSFGLEGPTKLVTVQSWGYPQFTTPNKSGHWNLTAPARSCHGSLVMFCGKMIDRGTFIFDAGRLNFYSISETPWRRLRSFQRWSSDMDPVHGDSL